MNQLYKHIMRCVSLIRSNGCSTLKHREWKQNCVIKIVGDIMIKLVLHWSTCIFERKKSKFHGTYIHIHIELVPSQIYSASLYPTVHDIILKSWQLYVLLGSWIDSEFVNRTRELEDLFGYSCLFALRDVSLIWRLLDKT